MKKQRRGLLIVIEGADGSGKGTQSRRLVQRLRGAGIRARRIAFPRYAKSFFGGMAGQYLRGEFDCAGTVHPRLASLLYAADRWEARERMLRWLAAGETIVCDRYVDSNKAHQAARLPLGADAAKFIRWIDRLEYSVLKLPRPDFTIFLHVPSRIASDLVGRKARRSYLRGKRRDIHEADQGHLRKAERIYLGLAAGRGRNKGRLIPCVEKGVLLSRGQVADKVWESLRPILRPRG